MPETRILLGVIGRPHGVRGLVHVTSHTADPAALAEYGPLSDDKGHVFTLAWRGDGIAELTHHADGTPTRIADRDAAARLTNRRLYIERARLPAPDDDEFYLADLIGLAAFDQQGRDLGRVTAVHDHGAGAFLEIGPTLLIPFTRAAVPEIDLAAGRLVVVPPDETPLSRHAGLGREADQRSEAGEGAGTDPNIRHAGAWPRHPRLADADPDTSIAAGPPP